jgi:hypothetical protein
MVKRINLSLLERNKYPLWYNYPATGLMSSVKTIPALSDEKVLSNEE